MGLTAKPGYESTVKNGYRFEIEVFSGDGVYLGEIGDYDDLQIEFSSEITDYDTGSFAIPSTSIWAPFFNGIQGQIVLIHILISDDDGVCKKWTGRVDDVQYGAEWSPTKTTINIISDKIWYKHIICWSAPFSPIGIQAPKRRVKTGPAISQMKQFIIDNLIRIQAPNLSGLQQARLSTYNNNPGEFPNVKDIMTPVVMPSISDQVDTSPVVALMAQMTPADELCHEVCKDYNLLPSAEMIVPGRDPKPDWYTGNLDKPLVVLDIVDKDLSRTRSQWQSKWKALSKEALVFVRGLFGRYDAPPPTLIKVSNTEQLKQFFGDNPTTDPWVIFRRSHEHWGKYSYRIVAPRAVKSIAGGKSQDFLNKGISLLINTAIKGALSMIGLAFVGDIITGELDDILLAYQVADDNFMRENLGKFALPESYDGKGVTAYSFDSTQALRTGRIENLGFYVGEFTGGLSAFKPFKIFRDFDLLDPVGWESDDGETIYTERIKKIAVQHNRGAEPQFEINVGRNERMDDPMELTQRQQARFSVAIKAAFNVD